MLWPTHPIEHYADPKILSNGFGWNETYAVLLHNIRDSIPFSLARYTDGEWFAIWKEQGSNVDGHQYYSDMGDALAEVLISRPEYVLGVQWLGMKHHGDAIVSWLRRRGLDMQWVPGEILHEASQAKQLHRFVEVLRDKPVLVVGKPELERLPLKAKVIQIPIRDAWTVRKKVISEVIAFVKDVGRESLPVILYSASMGAEYMIDRVYHESPSPVIQVDCGSIWDPYLGIKTRRYHRSMSVTLEDLTE